jgi:hypothetical protein
MSNIFWYQRPIKKRVPGVPGEDGTTPPDTEVIEIFWDCFNIDKVIRGHWSSPDQFVVMLDDGHEQADDVEKPKLNAKRQIVGVDIKRERAWFVSQIPLIKEDVERFRLVSEKISAGLANYSTLK